MGHHSQPIGGLIGDGSYSSAEVQLAYSTAPADRVATKMNIQPNSGTYASQVQTGL